MRTIELRLVSALRRLPDQLTVTLTCRLRNGSTWRSDALPVSVEGIATLILSDAQWKQIVWRSMQYEVLRDEQPLTVASIDGPERIGETVARVVLTIERAVVEDEPPVVTPSTPQSEETDIKPHGPQPPREPRQPQEPQPPVVTPSTPRSEETDVKSQGPQPPQDPHRAREPRQEQKPQTYQVSGHILTTQGKPVSKHTVVAYDRDILAEQILGVEQTDTEGAYTILYTPDRFANPAKKQADLIVRVYETSDLKAEPLASSPLIIRAAPHEVVNLSVGDTQFRGLSLYERTADSLTPLVKNKPWADIKLADIWLLADRTGMRTAQVAQFVQANRLAGEMDIPNKLRQSFALLFFALLKAGVAPDLSSLLRQPDRLLRRVLVQAIQRNWIPPIEDIDAVLQGIRQPRAGAILQKDENNQRLLTLAGLNAARQQTLFEHFLAEGQASESAWKRLERKPGFDASTVNALRDTLEMNALTGGDSRLLAGVKRDHQVQSPRDLTRLSQGDWAKLIQSELSDLPGTVSGGNEAERVQVFSQAIVHSIEARYPTAAVANRWLADNELPKGPNQDFFKENPDFDFAHSSVREQLAGKRDSAAKQQRTELEQVESLFHVTPVLDKFASIKSLWQGGIRSAGDITRIGRSQFRRSFASALGGTQTTDEVYAKAQHATAYNLALTSKANLALNGVEMQVLPSVTSKMDSADRLTLEDLFGSMTTAACGHCESSLSPSAYLVDLLDFVSRATDSQHGSALEHLLSSRRPDIAKLKLNCANSDTVLPYIDLVNELLENAVVQDSGFGPQTSPDKTSAELLAEPENTNLAAYDPLKVAIYPWTLPFDLDFERSHVYLEQLGVPRHELVLALNQYDEPGAEKQSAGDFLGLNTAQIDLVSSPLSNENFKLVWGFFKRNLSSNLADIESLLARSGLDFEVVQAILETNFVNPDGLQIIGPGGGLQHLSVELLDRFYRFSRLHAWTDPTIPIADLDLMLGTLDETGAGARNLLNNLVALLELNRDGGFDFDEMASWWATPGQLDRALFAASAGYSLEEITRFESLHGHIPDTPQNLRDFWANIETVESLGFSLTHVVDLLSPPGADSVYSLEAAEATLLALQAALNALIVTADQDPNLASQQRIDTIEQTLVDRWGVKQAVLSDFVARVGWLSNPAFSTRESFTDAEKSRMVLLHKQVDLFDHLALNPADYEYLENVANSLVILNPATLPSTPDDGAKKIGRFLSLIKHQVVNVQRFDLQVSLFAACDQFINDEVDLSALVSALAGVTDWDEAELGFLIGNDGFAWPSIDAFYDDSGILKLDQAFQLSEALEMVVEDAWMSVKFDRWNEIKAVLTANYAEEKWLEVARQLHDPLREKRRDALLAYVIDQNPQFADDFDVYTHYLIDSEMSACYETSRTKQANASVQQYIQRILLNLEEDLAFYNKDDVREWEWRKNYRVWEANRKVFLYPENWIEPELRDNKTELFEELESALLQDEVREDTAEAALLTYARTLHEVSNLEISALIEDPESKILYVFSRTRDLPHVYFLCQRSATGVWSGWRKLDIDIEGDHLIPVIYNRKLHLFWPTFEEMVDDQNDQYIEEMAQIETDISTISSDIQTLKQSIQDLEKLVEEYRELKDADHALLDPAYEALYTTYYDVLNEAVTITLPGLETDLKNANKKKEQLIRDYTYLRISLSWSFLDYLGEWSPKKVSQDVLNTIWGSRHVDNPTQVFFETEITADNTLELTVLYHYYLESKYLLGRFVIDVCADAIITNPLGEQESWFTSHRVVLDSSNENQRLRVWPDELEVRTVSSSGAVEEVLLFEDLSEDTMLVSFQPAIDDHVQSKYLGLDDGRVYIAQRSGTVSSRMPQDEIPDVPLYDPERSPEQPSQDGPPQFDPPQRDFPERIPEFEDHRPDVINDDLVFSGNRAQGDVVFGSKQPAVQHVSAFNNSVILDKGIDTGKLDYDMLEGSVIQPGSAAYKFVAFYHPYSCLFIKQLTRYGLDGLYEPDADSDDADMKALVHQSTPDANKNIFNKLYDITENVKIPYPQEIIELSVGQPYAIYNWELFFHAPLLIATRLTQNQKFEEAQRWFHYIFDPTIINGEGTARYWRFGPFYDEQRLIESGDFEELIALAEQGSEAFNAQVAEWEANPFNPHAIARLRIIAYMRTTVMKYLDNLLAWGDHLFRRDTMESLSEALQIYVVAAQLLGPRPLVLDGIESDSHLTAGELLGISSGGLLGALNDGWRAQFAFSSAGVTASVDKPSAGTSFLNTLLTFCLPPNDKLYTYWDTVADRLFKLRHCMNIEGIVRQLPLYEPPIDPALLVKAAAAGLSIQTALADLNASRPHYRFRVVLQKALEFTNEVKSFGGALLAALEKRDAEELAEIRAAHEVALADRLVDVRKDQLDEQETNLEVLLEARKNIITRIGYYQSLLDQGYLPVELDEHDKLKQAHVAQQTAGSLESLAAVMFAIPNIKLGICPGTETGGQFWGNAARSLAQVANLVAGENAFQASKDAREGAKIRREMEWRFQMDMASKDLVQHDKTIVAAEIRKAIAERDLENQELQLANAEEAESFLKDKFTNQVLYSWMIGEISSIYFQAYQLAYDMAKQAEAAYRHELGVGDASFIEYGYWDSLRKGLLSGEKLMLDLRRMEAAFMSNNTRERELTKHVSLAQLNPMALLELIENGSCEISIPEVIFDLDYPGHYFRRIKSVSLTIPAVTGPYTTLGCTLTLTNSSVRQVADLGIDPVPESVGVSQAIATSSGQSDSGLFLLDFSDERYLPFEGAGVISTWQLKLTDPALAQFSYDLISDVIFHIHYTARENEVFRDTVETKLKMDIDALLETAGVLTQMISVRSTFPDAWARLLAAEDTAGSTLSLDLTQDLFPYLISQHEIKVIAFDFLVNNVDTPNNPTDYGSVSVSFPTNVNAGSAFEKSLEMPSLAIGNLDLGGEKNLGQWDFDLSAGVVAKVGAEIDDIVLLCHYKLR